MTDEAGNWLTFNGEIYNYLELRDDLGRNSFATKSDTEVILHAYRNGASSMPASSARHVRLRPLGRESAEALLRPRSLRHQAVLLHAGQKDRLYFASEVKALLPFLPSIETDRGGLKEYLSFQFCFQGKTLFNGVARIAARPLSVRRHGRVGSRNAIGKSTTTSISTTRRAISVRDSWSFSTIRSSCTSGPTCRSAAYISGGLDSSIVACLAARDGERRSFGLHRASSAAPPKYDESPYARDMAKHRDFRPARVDIDAHRFPSTTCRRVIYHLDYPVAGPGSFPQYMVSQLASKLRKVVLGGQGGDEIFGGYVRYLIAYFEQCIKAAIHGTSSGGNFIVTYESIIPNLSALREYKPLMQEFCAKVCSRTTTAVISA